MEKKPVVGIEDLSSHHITMTSSSFNTQSKCKAFGPFHNASVHEIDVFLQWISVSVALY